MFHNQYRKAGMLFVLILIFITGCKSEPIEPTPTKIEPITATGSIQFADGAPNFGLPNTLEMKFYPDGGSVTGKGTIQGSDFMQEIKVSGHSNENGTASGKLNITMDQAVWQLDWKGEISVGKIEGEIPSDNGVHTFLLTY
ncbi:MAG: hypothetical protein E4G94_05780 [ANME-2 cluster archaeon]|nr:MAG: hypothetical protein E4G94_05780 [ANME-2 cluster archaeon]